MLLWDWWGEVIAAVLAFLITLIFFQWRRARDDKVRLEDVQAKKQELTAVQAELQWLRVREAQLNESLSANNLEITRLSSDKAVLEERVGTLDHKIKWQSESLVEMLQRSKEQFELMGKHLLETQTAKAESLSDKGEKRLTELLEPLRNSLTDFSLQVETTYGTERSERGVLRGELSKLMELNQTMSEEARKLSQALKGQSQVQGHWGELVLENLLMSSGLRAGEDFLVQTSFTGGDGSRNRPDVILVLPEGRHLIIDSKVSLSAYMEAIAPEVSAESVESLCKLHVESVKKHIEELAKKKYFEVEGIVSPDVVLLFIPIENALSFALKGAPQLLEQAWEKNIALVTPTTLLSVIKMVRHLWKVERQEKNAFEIARRGGLLFDKFVSFTKDLEELGDRIRQAGGSYDQVLKKLTFGQGSLVRQAEMLQELGVRAQKKLTLKSEEGPDLVDQKSHPEARAESP